MQEEQLDIFSVEPEPEFKDEEFHTCKTCGQEFYVSKSQFINPEGVCPFERLKVRGHE